MLQRAASNAYSWWWASHIRTKQSKWIEQNLQDMEEKVKYILNLIEEDGDSFAKRAEMYYKKRPELINFVEDSFRAYRALAERYDHISGELQNANNTIATVFPEQAQFAMDEEDDDGSPKAATYSLSPSKLSKAMPEAPKLDIPKAWKNQKKGAKGLSRLPTKKVQPKKATSSTTTTSSRKSKAEALVEIDRLQKGILSLQTEKEFFKSSFESGLAKYWEIEKHITEMQEEVCILQDEFSVGTVIEDDEARTLMAATALKSCQETLSKLQEKQEQSAEEAKVEYQRIKDAHEKLETLKNEFLSKQMDQLEPSDENDSTSSDSNLKNLEQEVGDLRQERLELELVRKKIREHFEMNSDTSLTVTELAEKIDELVNKVISLEYAVSSQTALIKRLRSETDDIQVHLRNLEENKATLVKGSNNLSNKLRNLDEKLSGIQDLNRSVEDQNNNLQTHFTEACCNLNHLSEKLHFVKADEEAEIMGSPQTEMGVLLDAKIYEKIEERKILVTCGDGSKNSEDTISEVEETDQVHNLSVCSKDNEKDSGQSKVSNSIDISEECEDPKQQGKVEKQDLSQTEDDVFNVDSQEDCNVNHLSENLHFVKPCEEADITDSPQAEMGVLVDAKTHETLKEGEDMVTPSGDLENSKDTKTNLEEETGDIQNLSLSVKNDEQDTDHSKRNSADDSSEKREEPKQLDKFEKQDSNRAEDNFFNLDSQERSTEQENLPNWQQLFLNGLEGREKILLAEYTSILRNYKETKKKLSEAEKKNRDNAFETMVQLRELKRANAVKDEEIRSLRQNICFLKTSFDGNLDNNLIEFKDSQQVKPYVDMAEGSTFQFPNIPYSDHQPVFDLLEDRNVEPGARIKESTATGKTETYPTEEEIKVILVDEPHAISTIEEKFRRDIDELLEENLEFWLRFSTSFHQIQKFRTTMQDLQAEFLKLKENKKQDANSSTWRSLKSDARPIYKHLREIQTELTVWLEQNALLKDELQYRFSSLCTIQEEISKVSKAGSETEEAELTSYQAAKFQGEVLNMQQENNKVADELQAGLDHVRGLQFEIEKTLSKLDEDFDLSGSKSHQHHVKHSSSRPRIPLRSFIFGVKQKKQRPSIFKCMNPALQKQYSDLTSGFPP